MIIYSLTITANPDYYSIGKYIDIWYVTVKEETNKIENTFQIYPDLWFTSTSPIIYDFNFSYRPNRIRKNSKRWLMIEISPNVPSQSDLFSYYTNLAIVSPVTITITKNCGQCPPSDQDVIVDAEPVEIREKCLAYYFLDTCEMDVGIYDIFRASIRRELLYFRKTTTTN